MAQTSLIRNLRLGGSVGAAVVFNLFGQVHSMNVCEV